MGKMSSNLDDFFEETDKDKKSRLNHESAVNSKSILAEKKKTVLKKPKKKEKKQLLQGQKLYEKHNDDKTLTLDVLLEENPVSPEGSKNSIKYEKITSLNSNHFSNNRTIDKDLDTNIIIKKHNITDEKNKNSPAIINKNIISLQIISRPKQRFKLSPLNFINLIETIRVTPGYKNRLNYTLKRILPKNKEITAQELASLLSITVGEAALILHDAKKK